MYFLAKLSQFLISPNTWLLILLVWFLFTNSRRTKRRLGLFIVTAVALLTNGALYKWVMHAWQPAPVSLTSSYQTGIVLSGMAGHGPDGRGYFGESADRFIQTLKLYNQGIIKKIIISGGDGSLGQKQPKEADFIYDELVKNKVAPPDIIIENRSRNTYENALFAKKITDSLQLKSPTVLITSAMHMPRSVLLFSKAGVPVVAYPCNYKILDNHFFWGDFLPNFGLLEKWGILFKEWLGIMVYKISGKA